MNQRILVYTQLNSIVYSLNLMLIIYKNRHVYQIIVSLRIQCQMHQKSNSLILKLIDKTTLFYCGDFMFGFSVGRYTWRIRVPNSSVPSTLKFRKAVILSWIFDLLFGLELSYCC